jgi:hypothetical protein
VRGGKTVMPPILSENITAIPMKFTWMIHTSFVNTSITVNILLYMMIKTLYINVVQFPASVLEHIMNEIWKLKTNCNHTFVEFILIEI